MKIQHPYWLLATLCGRCLTAQASEGGGSTYTAGVENYMAGAMPPPGLHLLGYGERYSADTMRDNSGQNLSIPGFKVTAAVAALRLVWSTPQPLWGGNLLFHSILPLVDLRVAAGGASQHKTAWVTSQLALAWPFTIRPHCIRRWVLTLCCPLEATSRQIWPISAVTTASASRLGREVLLQPVSPAPAKDASRNDVGPPNLPPVPI